MQVLYPAKLAVQFLSKKAVNLIECNTTIEFLLNQLDEQNSQLSQKVFLAIKEKIKKRRHDVLQSLILYLQDFNYLDRPSHFPMASVSNMNQLAVKMMERLFYTQEESQTEFEEQENHNFSEQKSIAEQLADAIKSASKPTKTVPTKRVDFKNEMKIYAKTKTRTPILDRFLEGLKTIQATSVAAERRFSETNILISKIRNRLGDENINAIAFLKCYFRNNLT